MKTLLTMVFILVSHACIGQISISDPAGDVAGDKAKLYYEYNKEVTVLYQVEGDETWYDYSLTTGVYYIDLNTCGNGPGRLCNVLLKVKNGEPEPIQGGKRYEVIPEPKSKKFKVRLKR